MEPPSKLLVVLYHKDKVLSASNVFGLSGAGPRKPLHPKNSPPDCFLNGRSSYLPRGLPCARPPEERKKPDIEKDQSVGLVFFYVGVALSFQGAAPHVFSALMSLTAVFGMGTGGPSSL